MTRCGSGNVWRAAALVLAATAVMLSAQRSRWVFTGDDGRLHYTTDDRGNRIMDFSYAGYKAGGVRPPDVRVARRVAPGVGDSTARIQAAIDAVSALPPDADGLRGAILLDVGAYEVAGTLRIAASGVVLRGSGSGVDGTVMRVSGAPHRFIDISGTGSWQSVGQGAAIVVAVDTQDSTTFAPTVRRVTIDDVHMRHTMPFTAAAAPADFALSGTQILLLRSSVSGEGVWPVVTQAGVTGPNVVLNFRSETAGVAPHQRWATGLLVDDSEFTGGTERRPNIAFSNREYAGSGHGWSVGWAVAWNVKADYILIQQPPGAKNWCIGCSGKPASILWHGGKIPLPNIPSDTFESPDVPVAPKSLYLAQLRDRLGERAVVGALGAGRASGASEARGGW